MTSRSKRGTEKMPSAISPASAMLCTVPVRSMSGEVAAIAYGFGLVGTGCLLDVVHRTGRATLWISSRRDCRGRRPVPAGIVARLLLCCCCPVGVVDVPSACCWMPPPAAAPRSASCEQLAPLRIVNIKASHRQTRACGCSPFGQLVFVEPGRYVGELPKEA